ncbi:MAG: hypothetical protein JXR52_13050 [Bacteroidales bacterium]|nr:hypothetical protein [Bacteroidales bacterium]MBN2699747.1 hypothetical protein [Bacteroidales bacterium]
MRYYKTLLPFLFLILLTGCEFESYEAYELPLYDGAFTWVKVTSGADWPKRYDHASVVFNNRIWVLGGYNPGQVKGDTYFEDVWSSADGDSWILETERAPWHGRRGHSAVVFDNGSGEAIYVIGGFEVDEETGYRQYSNDVWKSTDGKVWTRIKSRIYPVGDSIYISDWFPRMNHSCVTARHNDTNYIYLIGGYTMQEELSGRYAMKYYNDVWRSADGISWDSLANNDYGIRAEHAAAVDPETDRIYVQGGTHGVVFEPPLNASHPITGWQGVWSTDNGTNWTLELDTTLESGYLWRSDHQMVFYRDELWFLPGKTNSSVHYHFTEPYQFPIWKISETGSWVVDSDGDAFDARHGYSMVVFNDRVWIMGGMTSRHGQSNDVWAGEIIN